MSIPFRSQRPIEPNLTMPSAPIFMDRPGKSSLTVSLVLVGSAGLVGCNSNNQAQGTRYEYANREECVLDWGETECPPESNNRYVGGHGGSYVYYRYGNYDKRKTTHAKSVTRGGFGGKASSSRGS